MPEELMAVVPQMQTRKITFDIFHEEEPPKVDDFLVTIGKGFKANSVYLVAEARVVNPRAKRNFDRWALTVIRCPELLKKTQVERVPGGTIVLVDGKLARPMVWYSRKKKTKTA